MRGDLVSRPVGDVLAEARALFDSGVRELLVVSQDTSAYGVDVKYRTGFFDGRPVRTRMLELCEQLALLAEPHGAWVRLHYVYPYPHVDELLPLMASGRVLPYLDVPFQHSHPDVLRRMKRPASGERNLERIQAWRRACPQLALRSTFIAGFPGETERRVRAPAAVPARSRDRPRRLLCLFAGGRRRGQRVARRAARRGARRAACARDGGGRSGVGAAPGAPRRRDDAGAGRPCARRSGARARAGAATPTRPRSTAPCSLLPPTKASTRIQVGEFVRARVVAARGHDLIAEPL